MLEGHNIICIASSNWEAMWVNAQHLMSRLARRNRVFYVNNMGLRPPSMAMGRDAKQALKRLGSWFRGARRVDDNLWIYDPINVPIYDSPVMRVFNRLALRGTLRHYQKILDLRDPILWAFLPTAAGLVGHLGEKLAIYHCVDDYSSNPRVSREYIQRQESELMSKADIVFVTSPKLLRDKSASNRDTHYFGNVANAAHFARALHDGDGLPDGLKGIPRPIVGYQGNIASYKTDLDLILHVARSRPDWSIVLVGPTGWGDPTTDIRPLASMPNIHFVGRVSYEDLPRYVREFDVALIPFRISDSTQASFPMKFFEYLALGKPVVSTALDALAQWAEDPDFCRMAGDSDEFVRLIDQSLAENHDAELIAKRQALARENDWEQRLEQIGRVVTGKLEAKKR